MVQVKFLVQFREPYWEVLSPGRLAVLRLRGPRGGLNIVTCYLPSGTVRTIAADRASYMESEDQPEPDNSIREQRLDLMGKMTATLQPAEALTVLTGDFNFAMNKDDRLCKNTGVFTGGADHLEAGRWKSLFRDQLTEIVQPDFAHSGPRSSSRIDRAYMNIHLSDQLDKHIFCTALEWQERISDHRPLSFGRRSITGCRADFVAEYLTTLPEWAPRVAAAFEHRAGQEDAPGSALSRLKALKECMHGVSKAMRLEQTRLGTPPDTVEGKLALVMATLRRLETHGTISWHRLAAQLPELARTITRESWAKQPHRVLATLRDETVKLARARVKEEIEDLTNDMPELEPAEVAKRRGNIQRKLTRLAPGRSGAITALQLADGTISHEPEDVVSAIKGHWEKVFSHKPTSPAAREAFAEEGRDHPDSIRNILAQTPEDQWDIRKSDIRKAISTAHRSAVGPDGVPYAAWQAMRRLGVDTLWEAARELEEADGLQSLESAFPPEDGVSEFNAATLICIPKKIAGRTDDGIAYHLPQHLRPLSIVNTDNRLIASAARYRYEEMIEKAISPMQQGFLKGRSMLRKVLDIDTKLRTACAESGGAGGVFFDFEAAFPSLSHDYLHGILEQLGLPRKVRRLVRSLYWAHGCRVAHAGCQSAAFEVAAGIRQGCPLSPLLFALAVEPLLRALASECPTAVIRAYADDIAAVDNNLADMLLKMVPIFNRFAEASGLHLNLPKLAVVPVGDLEPEAVRQQLHQLLGWGTVPVRLWAEYLGFTLGPEGSGRAWNKALSKVKERSGLWAALGFGHLWATRAYSTYIASTLTFLLQLEVLPDSWKDTEASAMRKLFPGPGWWATPQDLQTTRAELHFPAEVPDMHLVSIAAKLRVLHREYAANGGLRVRLQHRAIVNAISYSGNEATIRLGRLGQWMRSSFAHKLVEAEAECEARGVSIESVEDVLYGDMPMPLTKARARRVLHGAQREAVRQLAARRPKQWERRLRARLEQFTMHLLPGRRAMRAIKTMRAVKGHIPPRAQAAIVRTWMSGWCSAGRFQQSGRCMWGCPHGEDDVRRYACCTRLATIADEVLQTGTSDAARARAEDFLLLRPGAADAATTLRNKALRLTVAYQLHNKARHNKSRWERLPPAMKKDAFRQAVLDLRR